MAVNAEDSDCVIHFDGKRGPQKQQLTEEKNGLTFRSMKNSKHLGLLQKSHLIICLMASQLLSSFMLPKFHGRY